MDFLKAAIKPDLKIIIVARTGIVTYIKKRRAESHPESIRSG
jgi:hypothetical protein